jgi:hypothetical protein
MHLAPTAEPESSRTEEHRVKLKSPKVLTTMNFRFFGRREIAFSPALPSLAIAWRLTR